MSKLNKISVISLLFLVLISSLNGEEGTAETDNPSSSESSEPQSPQSIENGPEVASSSSDGGDQVKLADVVQDQDNNATSNGTSNVTLEGVAVKLSSGSEAPSPGKPIKFKQVSCFDPRKPQEIPPEETNQQSNQSETNSNDTEANSMSVGVPANEELVADSEPVGEDEGTASLVPEISDNPDMKSSLGVEAQLEAEAEASSDPESNGIDEEIKKGEAEEFQLRNKTVEIVNVTYLMNDILYQNPAIKSKATPGNCTLVLFYANWCPFSAKAAPHFNAVPRAYPPLRVAAIDAYKYKSTLTYFGILGVPTVALFHNGRLIAKFNESQFSLNKFSDFIEHFTDLKHEERMNVTAKDFDGPLSSTPVKDRDWLLFIAWAFIIISCTHYLTKSAIWWRFVEFVRATWVEAEEVEHEHID